MLNNNRRSHTQGFFYFFYLITSIVDLVICTTAFPVALSLAFNREPVLFANTGFCTFWALLWEALPFLSVFLMALVALGRAMTLLWPLAVVSRIRRVFLGMLCFYIVWLIVSKVIPFCIELETEWHRGTHYHKEYLAHSHFTPTSVYCFVYVHHEPKYRMIYSIQTTVQFGLPAIIIPVASVTCITVILRLKNTRKAGQIKRKSFKKTSTLTVLIFCTAYMLCNIPVFINYTMWASVWLKGAAYKDLYNTPYLYWYSWSLTHVVSTCVNSCVNPTILVTRLPKLREWLWNQLLKQPIEIIRKIFSRTHRHHSSSSSFIVIYIDNVRGRLWRVRTLASRSAGGGSTSQRERSYMRQP